MATDSLRPGVHARHHDLIAERVARATAATGARRKRLGGDAASTIAGHLRSGHGWRRSSGPPLSIADLLALHDRMHADG